MRLKCSLRVVWNRKEPFRHVPAPKRSEKRREQSVPVKTVPFLDLKKSRWFGAGSFANLARELVNGEYNVTVLATENSAVDEIMGISPGKDKDIGMVDVDDWLQARRHPLSVYAIASSRICHSPRSCMVWALLCNFSPWAGFF